MPVNNKIPEPVSMQPQDGGVDIAVHAWDWGEDRITPEIVNETLSDAFAADPPALEFCRDGDIIRLTLPLTEALRVEGAAWTVSLTDILEQRINSAKHTFSNEKADSVAVRLEIEGLRTLSKILWQFSGRLGRIADTSPVSN